MAIKYSTHLNKIRLFIDLIDTHRKVCHDCSAGVECIKVQEMEIFRDNMLTNLIKSMEENNI